jgi:hypothetical protein
MNTLHGKNTLDLLMLKHVKEQDRGDGVGVTFELLFGKCSVLILTGTSANPIEVLSWFLSVSPHKCQESSSFRRPSNCFPIQETSYGSTLLVYDVGTDSAVKSTWQKEKNTQKGKSVPVTGRGVP